MDYKALYEKEASKLKTIEDLFGELLEYDRESLNNEIKTLRKINEDYLNKIKALEENKGTISKKANTQYNNQISLVETELQKYKNLFNQARTSMEKSKTELENTRLENIELLTRVSELENTEGLLEDIRCNTANIIEICVNGFKEIKDMVDNKQPVEEIKEAVEEIEVQVNKRLSTRESKLRDIAMARDLAKGMNQREVANKHMNTKYGESALSKKLKTGNFPSLVDYFLGNIPNYPEYYKDVIQSS